MPLYPGWLARLRALHDSTFNQDWQLLVDLLNERLGLAEDCKFSLVVPKAPPPLVNGDVEAVRPRRWTLVVSLNHQLGNHVVEASPDALWKYWREYNRNHWYTRFFRPLVQVASGALGDAVCDEREYATSRMIFIELCPYASQRFAIAPESIAAECRTERGFELAAEAMTILSHDAEPAMVLVNGLGAMEGFKALMGKRLGWVDRVETDVLARVGKRL